MRARYATPVRYVLRGGSPDEVEAVLAMDRLADAGLADRLVARLEAEGFGELTNKQRDTKLRKLSAEIDAAEKEHLSARKAAAMAELEAEFAGVSPEAA
jgi:hypothetical protein